APGAARCRAPRVSVRTSDAKHRPSLEFNRRAAPCSAPPPPRLRRLSPADNFAKNIAMSHLSLRELPRWPFSGRAFTARISPVGLAVTHNYSEGDVVKLTRRGFLHLAAGVTALPALWRVAQAQSYPARPVRLIVGFPAGGASDIVGRLMAQRLSERLGQQFIVENRPGANTNISTEAVVGAGARGYTPPYCTTSDANNARFYGNLDFNFIRDIAPVAGIIHAPLVMVVNPSFPAKTVSDFIAYAKTSPGQINMASAGIGTAGHLAGELFKMMVGI